jgi:hypothetical protein
MQPNFATSINSILCIHLKRLLFLENEKSGGLNVEYQVRLRFMAFAKQARYGVFKSELADVGWFDFVGHDAK